MSDSSEREMHVYRGSWTSKGQNTPQRSILVNSFQSTLAKILHGKKFQYSLKKNPGWKNPKADPTPPGPFNEWKSIFPAHSLNDDNVSLTNS